jgi:acetyltransferase-like isoleucine patch superfamily enzyme
MTSQPPSEDTLSTAEFARLLAEVTSIPQNRFHPFVWILGQPEVGEGTYIGGFSEINASGARVVIGKECDIASFVSINCADSHKRCIGLTTENVRRDICIEDHVFIGSHSVVKGGVHIGHHSVVGAGTVVEPGDIPPYSLVVGNPMRVRAGYYRAKCLGEPESR